MFRNIFKSSVKISKPLGRWQKPKTKKLEDIKVLLANHDSCGDIVCGNPKSLKNEIETILNKK